MTQQASTNRVWISRGGWLLLFFLCFVLAGAWIYHWLHSALQPAPLETTQSITLPKQTHGEQQRHMTVVADELPKVPTAISVFDANAPCPLDAAGATNADACIADTASAPIDPSCPAYKPIWAYISKDHGQSWQRVGCFATRIDASRALAKAKRNRVVVATASVNLVEEKQPNQLQKASDADKADNSMRQGAAVSSIQDVFKQNALPQSNVETHVSSEKTAKPEEAKTVETKLIESKLHEPTMAESSLKESKPNEQKSSEQKSIEVQPSEIKLPVKENLESVTEESPHDGEHQSSDEVRRYPAQFKVLFGLVPVERRVYPTEEMRDKAIAMWKKRQRLLEPDGSINDKYLLQDQKNNRILLGH